MELLINIVLLSFLLATALAIAHTEDLLAAVMLTGIYGFLSASFFVLMDAVDVAFTEAAVSSGISPLLMLLTLAVTGRFETTAKPRALPALILVIVTGVLLMIGTLGMPPFGDVTAPAHQHVAPRYLEQSKEEIGIPNVVTSVLASYRAFDTLGEVSVIFASGVGVMSLLRLRPGPSGLPVSDGAHPHKVLRVVSKTLIPAILIFALYVQFHGEYGPGGGFQAGVIFAAAFIIYTMFFGVDVARRVLAAPLLRILAALGLLLYGSVGLVSVLNGKPFLDYSVLAERAVDGQHLGILLVELGLGVTVSMVMVLIFYSFVSRLPPDGDTGP